MLFEIVAQTAQPAKIGTRVARIFAEWRNRHQAAKLKMRHLHDSFRERRKIILRDTRFFFRGIKLNLDQHGQPFVRFARGVVKFQRQRSIVDGIDPIKQAGGAPRFIALQMSDQMPARLQVRELRLLVFPFLHAVLAECAHTRVVGGANRIRRNRFRGGHQNNFFRLAIRTASGAGHAFTNVSEVRRDRRTSAGHAGILARPIRYVFSQANATVRIVEYVRLSGILMSARGKFIALEGIDGSGKRTQLEMLSCALLKRGVGHVTVSFPHYDGFFGHMVARYLNGEFGSLSQVDAHFSALLYAGDRLENKAKLEDNLAQGKMIFADRYIGSNLAHQGSRVPRRQLAKFLRWIEQLEYGVYGLPREDLVVYLRLPAVKAQLMVGKKNARGYTRRRRDLQETNLAHLKAAADVYDRLAERPNWRAVDCMSESGHEMLAPEVIHREVMEVVESRVLRSSRRSDKS